MSEPSHFPSPTSAPLLVFLGWFLSLMLLWGLDAESIGIGELGVAQTLGLGAVAAIASRFIAPPHRERIGLRGFAWKFVPLLFLLLPVAFLSAEFQQIARALAPPPDAAIVAERVARRLQTDTPIGALETALVVVGLAPVVEEWLFRGVVQQGLVAHLGRIGGVSATAGLFAMTHMNPSDSFESTLVSFIGAFFTGCVLGAVRLATGSLLAAILLHAGVNGLLLAGVLLADVVPIAGWNTPAAHVSGWALAPSAVCVGVGLVWAARAARAEPRALPLPEPEDEDPFFG